MELCILYLVRLPLPALMNSSCRRRVPAGGRASGRHRGNKRKVRRHNRRGIVFNLAVVIPQSTTSVTRQKTEGEGSFFSFVLLLFPSAWLCFSLSFRSWKECHVCRQGLIEKQRGSTSSLRQTLYCNTKPQTDWCLRVWMFALFIYSVCVFCTLVGFLSAFCFSKPGGSITIVITWPWSHGCNSQFATKVISWLVTCWEGQAWWHHDHAASSGTQTLRQS